jgi:pseudoazurin
MFRMMLALGAAFVCACLAPAAVTDYQVRMLSQGMDGMMQFDPQLLKVAPGDTVHFTATNQGHNVQSLDGMIPEGARSFHSEIGQNLTVTFSVPGIYGYRCTPHGTLGMVGLIVVGKPVNEAAAKTAAMPGAAGRVFARLFQTLDSTKTAENQAGPQKPVSPGLFGHSRQNFLFGAGIIAIDSASHSQEVWF